jgi:hypothetical protein
LAFVLTNLWFISVRKLRLSAILNEFLFNRNNENYVKFHKMRGISWVAPLRQHTVSPVTNRPRLETRPPPHSHCNRRLRLQFERAPDDGQDGARNMLSGVYVTKQ